MNLAQGSLDSASFKIVEENFNILRVPIVFTKIMDLIQNIRTEMNAMRDDDSEEDREAQPES